MGCYDHLGCGNRPYPYTNFHRRRDHRGYGPGFRGPCRDDGRCDEFHPYPPRPFFHGPSKFY